MAHVESIIEAEQGELRQGMLAVPTMLHRKPVVATLARTDLMESGVRIGFSPVESPTSAIEPIGWDPEDGFLFDDQEGTGRTRRIRRRAGTQPLAADEATDDADSENDPGDDIGDGVVDEVAGIAIARFVPAPGRRPASIAANRLEVPPYDLVQTVHAVTGVHVGDARIDRSRRVSEESEELGAVAFTRGDVVHLPAELGPLDDPGVRAIAAHELIHVAQQRSRDGAVPPEDSDEGRELERQARAVQQRIAGGAPVTPAFVRTLPQRREGPVGVQRLVDTSTGYVGEDLSDHDYSDVEPGQTNDPFRWQLREGEPVGQPWSVRQDWARQFESTNATELQFRRDASLRTMATSTPPATQAELDRMHRDLDSAMPLQFGPQLGVAPYLDVPIATAPAGAAAEPGSAPAATSQAGGSAASGGASATGAAPTVAAPGSGASGGTDAGRQALATMLTAARGHAAEDVGDYSVEGLTVLGERRQAAERAHRETLLEAKAVAAHEAGQADATEVNLTSDELRQIQTIVDTEHINPGLPYLDDTTETTGKVGDLVRLAEAAGRMVHRTNPAAATESAAAPPAGAAAPPAAAAAPAAAHGGATEHATGATADSSAAGQLIASLTTQAAATHHTEATIDLTPAGLVAAMQQRLNRERELRVQVLNAKVHDARAAHAPDDFVVTLSSAECNSIRAVVDAAYPMLEGIGVYLGDDETVSMNMQGTAGGAATPETVEAAIARHAQAGPEHHDAPAATAEPATGAHGHEPAAARQAQPTTADPAPAHTAGAAATTTAATTTAPADAAPGHEDAGGHATDGEHPISTVEALNDVDLERLTRKLWSRIRRELRTELLIDRERSGSLADTR